MLYEVKRVYYNIEVDSFVSLLRTKLERLM
jgi:hypothetical protein